MDFKKQYATLLFISVFFYFGCNTTSVNNQSAESDSTNLPNKKTDTSSINPKVFPLPAPLQVATIIKNANIPFMEKELVSPSLTRVFSSDYMRALNLGVYSIDIGYAIVFGQNQTSLNYYKSTEKLLAELGISPDITPPLLKRFKDNMENTDSLCSISLESFNRCQMHFQENKREYISLYIIAGSYLEGLYLTLSSKNFQQTKAFNNLLGQQKLFLDNILAISNYMDKKPEFDDLYLKLGSLQEVYSPINVIIKENDNNQPLITSVYTAQQTQALLQKVTEIRNEIIK